ncbi:MAG: transporter [Alistipes sp.]
MKHISAHSFRTASMPLGMVIGVLLCRQIAAFDAWSGHIVTPLLIFFMLFFTFCRVDVRKMRLSMMHLWLLVVQMVGSLAVYFALLPAGEIIAQGAMICTLAPIAMAAVVIGGMLGANIETMAAYSLVCNLATALLAPVIISFTGNGECSMWQILAKVAPLLIAPFAVGQLCRFGLRPVGRWITEHNHISFYLWLVSLSVIVGRTTSFIIDSGTENSRTEIWLAATALVICIAQFALGRFIGARYGDKAAGGQSLGQKNTVLAVWMAQSFLHPLSSVAPTAYIVWQNVVNSYQIWKHK